MRLLIVDDEVWSRQLIKNILKWDEYGFNEIYEAGNGEEAITILEKRQINLIITDMRMPKIDGALLLQYLRDRGYDSEVIVMSGYEDYKYLHEALKTKAIDYLLKPVIKHELISAVQTGIERISENQSYQYIEEILRRDDLKNDFNKYYEVKNRIFKSLINIDEKELVLAIELLEKLFLEIKINDNLVQYIFSDLQRFTSKLYRDYNIDGFTVVTSDNPKIERIISSIMHISKTIKESLIPKKIDVFSVQKYIDNHFSETISLADIAVIFHVSKEYLSRLFKKEVGVSVQNYVTDKRIEYSKRLLVRHSSLSISTVCIMSGYRDLQYFYRVFKKRTCSTPIEYRNSNINIIQ